MAKITKENIEHVTKLARIEIDNSKIAKLTSDLDEILNYVKELGEAPTNDIESISQISGLENIVREDKVEESLSNEKVLQNAPEKEGNFIKVKKVFE